MRQLALLAAALVGFSCAVPLKGAMRPAPGPLSLASTPRTARVIFARPANFFGSAVVPTFIDPQRRMVFGQSPNDSYFAVDLEPGVYQVCPALMAFESAVAFQRDMTDHAWFDLGLRVPITELHVAAGNTYLLKVTLSWGPRVRVLPIIPGSREEEQLLAALPGTRPAEVVTLSDEQQTAEDPEALEAFYALCRDSSGATEKWLRMLPGESRPSTGAVPASP